MSKTVRGARWFKRCSEEEEMTLSCLFEGPMFPEYKSRMDWTLNEEQVEFFGEWLNNHRIINGSPPDIWVRMHSEETQKDYPLDSIDFVMLLGWLSKSGCKVTTGQS